MREVRTEEWSRFWDEVNRNERGSRVQIHKVEPDGARTEVARNLALEEVAYGRRDDCNDRISVRMSGESPSNHEIVEPIRIKLMESEQGTAYQSVIVEAEDGVTILTFHPTIKAAWLRELHLQ